MKKIYLLLVLFTCLFLSKETLSQVSLTSANGTYVPDFDAMGATTNLPAGWAANRIAGTGTANAALTPTVNNGSSNSGGVFNVGTTSASDRALGTLASGSTIPAFGVSFVNNTGSTINGFSLSGVNEQWRTGSNPTNETVFFEYSLNATSLFTGTWVPVSSLNLNEILTADNTNAAVDGNNAANRVAISGNISSLSLANGSTIWIRWRDVDNTGSDGMYAVDDLNISYTNVVAGNTVSVTAGSNASESGTIGTFAINFSTPTAASTDIDFSFGGAATFGTDYTVSYSAGTTPSTTSSGTLTVPSGTSSVTVTITPVDDAVVEPTEDVILTISNPQGGYSLGSPSSISINLTDNDVAPSATVAAGTNAAEPSTNGTFNITLSVPAPAGGVNITYSLSGTATQNTDYTDPQSGTVSVAAGNTTATVTLNVTDDAAFESTETIILTLTGADNGYTASGNATINLIDNDVAPPILLSSTYSQDFNSLASTGTGNPWIDNSTITGWYSSRTTYNAGNGVSNTGALYSFGATSDADRALGSIGSGSTGTVYYGARMKNNTGTTITNLRITYRGEQWRNGGTGTQQTVNFAYQTANTVTSLTAGTWTQVTNLNFASPVSNTTAGALDGNDPANQVNKSFTISGLNIPANDEVMIRWEDIDHGGADDGLAIDGLTVEANFIDVTPPAVATLSPSNGTANAPVNFTASITFDEAIQKGTGIIVLKKSSDNSIVQSFDVATSAVTVSGNSASFSISGLLPGTGYYIEVPNTAFEDLAGNDFAGFTGNGTWAFTTGSVFYSADFQSCSSSLSDGFTQFSVTGALTWACTTFGRDPANPAGSAAFPYGVQMNGFSGGTNVANTDWLISPSIDLTSTTYPLLSFWSRTAFNGEPLQLKVSTDYVSGDPTAATWTDINGKFPAQTSNVWTLSNNINLSAFKQPNVHFAFVYSSSNDDGARWTLDDISIDNSSTPPPPSITTSTNDIQYTFVASGSTANKTFTFTGNDITTDVTLTASSGFLLSKDGSAFSPSITYTVAEANNISKTVTVQFAPTQPSHNYTGTVTLSTSSLTSTINLKGTSIDPVNTLEVVNWNMEWFGHPSLGPTNDNQQQANAQLILQNIGADIFGLVEVVDESRLATIVSNMPGYSYVIGNYGSHVNPPDPAGGPVSDAQKEAFVYKTSMFSNISVRPLINNPDINSASYNNWASGRYPFLMTADVVLNGVTKTINFVLIHAKANTSPTNVSYTRREAAATELHDTLVGPDFANANVIVLGDFNDDLDQSITAGFTTTSYHAFTTDNANFFSPTLALSLAGKKSTVSFNDVIDHVMLSNEMQQYYMGSTASILTDVSSLVTNYGTTTTDHYPVFTRFAFDGSILPVKLTTFDAAKDGNRVRLTWSTAGEVNADYFNVERSSDGRNYQSIGTVNAAGNTTSTVNYQLADAEPFRSNNYYRLKMVDADRHVDYSRVLKIDFSKSYTFSFSPNPAKTDIYITVTNNRQALKLDIIDMNGKVVKTQTILPQNNKVSVSSLAKGMYILKVESDKGIYSEKLIIE